jgi:hypothetical protein
MPYATYTDDAPFKRFLGYSAWLHIGLVAAVALSVWIQRSGNPWGGIGGGSEIESSPYPVSFAIPPRAWPKNNPRSSRTRPSPRQSSSSRKSSRLRRLPKNPKSSNPRSRLPRMLSLMGKAAASWTSPPVTRQLPAPLPVVSRSKVRAVGSSAHAIRGMSNP